MVRSTDRGRSLLLDGWSLLLGLVLVWPLWIHSGMPLGRDMMFVPHQPFTDAAVGLGDAAPRAVPLDAVLALATTVLDGAVVARIVLPIVLALAGWGVHRLLRDLSLVPRLAAVGFAVWNPYVIERLALGQWALLAAYAALPWLGAAAVRYLTGGSVRALASVVLWAALASLTPTGGLLALATVVAMTVGRGRRWLVPVLLTVLLQLPWLVPALTGPAGAFSDADGVASFASRAEGPGGVVVAVLGLGGIWDAGSVPATRETFYGVAAAAVTTLVLCVGLPAIRRAWGTSIMTRMSVLAGMGLLLALLSSAPAGERLVRFLVVEVPGAGLLRDAQKFLAPLGILAALATAFAVQRTLDSLHVREYRLSLAVAVVVAPLVLLPDGAVTTGKTVRPVTYPEGFAEVADRLERSGDDSALASLPWRAYREFSWGSDVAAADPAIRWFDRTVRTQDELVVGDAIVQGEDPTARAITEALRGRPPGEVLPEYGVGWVLIYRDDPAAADLDLTGFEEVYTDTDLMLLKAVGDVQSVPEPGPGRRALVLSSNLAVAALLAASAVARIARRRCTRRVPW